MNGLEIFPFISFFVLITLISGRVVFLKRKRIKVNSGPGKRNNPVVLLFSAFLLIFLIWLFELIKPVFQISVSVLPELLSKPVIDSYLTNTAGVLVTSFALVFMLITLIHFKNSLRFGMDENNPGKLITTGIFSVSRNPFFLSLDIYFIGIALLRPGLFFIGYAVLAIISIHFFILKEEKFMQRIYGNEYLEYKLRVRRYL